MRDGLLRAVIDSPVVPLAQALVNLLLELQSNPAFDPQRQRVHVALQIITSENARD